MSVNLEKIFEDNKYLALTVNDLGEILSRENYALYAVVINENFKEMPSNDIKSQKIFLKTLYHCFLKELGKIY